MRVTDKPRQNLLELSRSTYCVRTLCTPQERVPTVGLRLTAPAGGLIVWRRIPPPPMFWMEADGFMPGRTSLEAPCVDSRVTGAAAGTEFRWLGGRVSEAKGGFGRSLTQRLTGPQDLSPALHRASPETSTSVDPEIDYEGLPQGAATSTHMLAGAVAGIMEHCLMYPIDCVKVSN